MTTLKCTNLAYIEGGMLGCEEGDKIGVYLNCTPTSLFFWRLQEPFKLKENFSSAVEVTSRTSILCDRRSRALLGIKFSHKST